MRYLHVVDYRVLSITLWWFKASGQVAEFDN